MYCHLDSFLNHRKLIVFVLLVLFCVAVSLSEGHFLKKDVKGTIDCDLCKFIVNDIDNLLQANRTINFIEKEINRVCETDLFKKHAQVCDSILDYGVVQLIHFISVEETPETVCTTQLKLCTSPKGTHKKL